MVDAMICTKQFLQKRCNQYVEKCDTTASGVLLLQDLATKAFIQNDRLVPQEDFYKKNQELSLHRSKHSKKQLYYYKFNQTFP